MCSLKQVPFLFVRFLRATLLQPAPVKAAAFNLSGTGDQASLARPFTDGVAVQMSELAQLTLDGF